VGSNSELSRLVAVSFSVVANPFGEQMAGMQMDKYFSQLLTEKFLRDKMMASEATFDSTHTEVLAYT